MPAILSDPVSLPKGAAREQAITAMDWFPTILELCGISRPEATNHAQQHPDIVERMTKLHEQWIREVVPKAPPESA